MRSLVNFRTQVHPPKPRCTLKCLSTAELCCAEIELTCVAMATLTDSSTVALLGPVPEAEKATVVAAKATFVEAALCACCL